MTDTLRMAAEALRTAEKDLLEWTPRHKFIDNALTNIATALAAIEAELARAPEEGLKAPPRFIMTTGRDPNDTTDHSLTRVPEDRERLASKFDGGGYVLGNVSCAEVATFLRSPVSGGAEEMRERAAQLIEQQQEEHLSNKDGDFRTVGPRREGNLAGLAFADAIRALPLPTEETP